MNQFLRIYVVVLSIAIGAPLFAAEDAEAAKEAYAAAQEKFDTEDYAEAALGFREAYRLKPSWKILYNIGQAEAAAKNYGAALESFEEYLAQGGDDVTQDRKDEVLSEVRRLRDMVGTLEVVGPAGAMVEVDGLERGLLPLPGPIKISAGVNHSVRIVQNDTEILNKQVRLGSGDTTTVDASSDTQPAVTVADDGAKPPPEEKAAPVNSASKKLKIAGWVSVGTGAALLIGGGVTGGMALSLDSELTDSCDDNRCTDPDDQKDLDKRDTMATLSTVFTVAGGVVAGTGIVLLIVGAKKNNKDTALIPFADSRAAGLLLMGRF